MSACGDTRRLSRQGSCVVVPAMQRKDPCHRALPSLKQRSRITETTHLVPAFIATLPGHNPMSSVWVFRRVFE